MTCVEEWGCPFTPMCRGECQSLRLPVGPALNVRRHEALDRPVLPIGSQERKDTPIYSGVLKYFPRALAYVAKVSKAGADKHCGGELRWDRTKSSDHADSVSRHLVEAGTFDAEDNLRHSGKLAWRALALLETELEATKK